MKRLILLSALVAAGCTNLPHKIAPSPVPASPYLSHSCPQLAAERADIKDRSGILAARLYSTRWGAKKDEVAYAHARGEYFAVQEAVIQKDCPDTPIIAQRGSSAAGGTAAPTPRGVGLARPPEDTSGWRYCRWPKLFCLK